jgi:DNA-binding transcriptional LysR family regulator
MINLEWYRSFVEVYRVGTVSGAAQVLHLTQPAVSQHVAALESALGHPLFQRMPRRMVPTDEGKRLYTEVIVAIERLESITTKKTIANQPQWIRLGTPQEFFTEQLLPRLPNDPNWLYRVQFGLVNDLITELLEGRLDMAIATQKIARSDLEYQLIYEESFWLVASPQPILPFDPILLQVDLTPLEQWLRTQPLIAYSEDLPIIRRFWRVVFGRRLDLVPQLVLPNLLLIRDAIVHCFGFSVLPNYLCESAVASGQLQLLLKPHQAVTNQIWLAYRKADRESLSVKFIAHLLT